MTQITCPACQANVEAFDLRGDYLSDAHRAALKRADDLRNQHEGCTLDPKTPLASRMLVNFQW